MKLNYEKERWIKKNKELIQRRRTEITSLKT